MDGIAYIFLNRNGVKNLGQVGGAFLMGNGQVRCFATQNQAGAQSFNIPARYKGCWVEDCDNDLDAVIRTFQKTRELIIPNGVTNNWGQIITAGSYYNARYTDWKRLDASNINPEQANAMLQIRRSEPYNLLARNCENNVYDVLHDENSGYGITANCFANTIYVGWVQSAATPESWFDNHIGASEQGVL